LWPVSLATIANPNPDRKLEP